MYRILCESYENYKRDFENVGGARLELSSCFHLLTNSKEFLLEKSKDTTLYKNANMLLAYLSQNQEQYPQTSVLMSEMSDRGIKAAEQTVVEETMLLQEQAKLLTSFMKLAYWY